MTVTNEESSQAFISAARYGDLEEIQDLLNNHGPNLLKCTGFSSNTPLHMASANGHTDVVDFLINRPQPCDVNQVNEAGNSALHWAALNGSLEVAKLLVGAGADVLLKNKMGRTSFYEAKQGGHEALAEYLLELIDEAEGDKEEEEDESSP